MCGGSGEVKTLSGTYKPARYVSAFYVLTMCLAAEGKIEDSRWKQRAWGSLEEECYMQR